MNYTMGDFGAARSSVHRSSSRVARPRVRVNPRTFTPKSIYIEPKSRPVVSLPAKVPQTPRMETSTKVQVEPSRVPAVIPVAIPDIVTPVAAKAGISRNVVIGGSVVGLAVLSWFAFKE